MSQTTHLLGYPPDARLLILNADDFGMCHAVNAAITGALAAGLIRSTTLMMPCPWALEAVHFLQDHPEVAFGVHLTVISDPDGYVWGPLTARDKVPSLVSPAGHFYNFQQMGGFLAQVDMAELETEFRAQIEAVLAAGLKPTHLDWHSLRFEGKLDILSLMFRLAKEYGLALRVIGRPAIEMVQGAGYPTIDSDFLDSYSLDPSSKPARYAQLLHDLPPGLSEWAIHPGLDHPELLAIEPQGNHIRQADYDFWTSEQAKALVEEEGVILLDYRVVQAVWRGAVHE